MGLPCKTRQESCLWQRLVATWVIGPLGNLRAWTRCWDSKECKCRTPSKLRSQIWQANWCTRKHVASVIASPEAKWTTCSWWLDTGKRTHMCKSRPAKGTDKAQGLSIDMQSTLDGVAEASNCYFHYSLLPRKIRSLLCRYELTQRLTLNQIWSLSEVCP